MDFLKVILSPFGIFQNQITSNENPKTSPCNPGFFFFFACEQKDTTPDPRLDQPADFKKNYWMHMVTGASGLRPKPFPLR